MRLFLFLAYFVSFASGFNILFMAVKKKTGGRRSLLDKLHDESSSDKRGQEITGVTLPEPGRVRGWEFGNNVRVASANVNGTFYAVQGSCT
jgi:hypothetical protein